jgi:hypothetical protein
MKVTSFHWIFTVINNVPLDQITSHQWEESPLLMERNWGMARMIVRGIASGKTAEAKIYE